MTSPGAISLIFNNRDISVTRRSLFTTLVPPLIFLLLPCLLLWRVIFLHEAFVPSDLLRDIAPWRTSAANLVPWNPLMWDGIAEFYPWRSFAAATLRSGMIPLWNPHEFCGTPFVANSQSAVFYPLNLLFCLLSVPTAFGASVLLHLFLTGLFTYGYLRRGSLRLCRSAALLGGVAWQLCHWQIAWLALPTFLCVSTWLPLALLLVDVIARKPTAVRAAGLGLCLGVMLLAGHLQIALYSFGLISAYAVFRVLPALRLLWPKFLGCAALVTVLTFGFAAPQLLPALELSRLSHRAGGMPTETGYAAYTGLAMPPFHLATLFFPSFFGNPTLGSYWGATNYAENACYVGVLTLLLALVALKMTWKTRPTTRFFGITAVIALLMALGTPLNALLFFGIPGFAQTGSPARILVLWSFCCAILAAIGTDALLKCESRQFTRAILYSASAFLGLATLAVGGTLLWAVRRASLGVILGNDGDFWRLSVGILFGGFALSWLHQRGSLRPAAFGGLLAILVALDLLGAGWGYNRSGPVSAIYPVTPLIAYLQQRGMTGRVMPLNRRWNLYQPPSAVLPPNAATVYGLSETQGYDSLQTGRYFGFVTAMNSGPAAPRENGNMVFTTGYASPQAEEAAARYVISLTPLSDPKLTYLLRDGSAYLYENSGALPRLRIANGAGNVRLEEENPTRLAVEIGMPSPAGTFVAADQWYPGWKATVGTRSAEIQAAPDVFRTVQWLPSDHAAPNTPLHIEMRYLPTTFRIGLYCFCLAFAVVAGLGAGRIVVRRGPPELPVTPQ